MLVVTNSSTSIHLSYENSVWVQCSHDPGTGREFFDAGGGYNSDSLGMIWVYLKIGKITFRFERMNKDQAESIATIFEAAANHKGHVP